MDNFDGMNFYKILEIDPSASSEEITAAYHRMLEKYNDDFERQLQINMAKTILLDPVQRQKFDISLLQSQEKEFINIPVYINDEQQIHLAIPIEINQNKDEYYYRHDHHHYVHHENNNNVGWTSYGYWYILPVICFVWWFVLLLTSR